MPKMNDSNSHSREVEASLTIPKTIQAQISEVIRCAFKIARLDHPNVPNETIIAAFLSAISVSILESAPCSNEITTKKKPIRVYVDGCFDIMHSGHYNALRQAKSLGDVLVVGVHSDEEISQHKGMPVMKNEERLEAVRACKWVDEVVFDTPYQPTLELLNRLNCDFVAHGDDMPVCADGQNAYDEVRNAGRLKIFMRTHGVSTTDIVGRLLSTTAVEGYGLSETESKCVGRNDLQKCSEPPSSSFHATTRRISLFSNHKSVSKNDRVVYIAGSFDLFHIGHIETLQQAKELGTYLYVGVHDDRTVSQMSFPGFPILNIYERVLNVLSCKWVDEVIISAPWAVNNEFIKSFNINVVACGGNIDEFSDHIDGEHRFSVPKSMGICVQLQTSCKLTSSDVIDRIVENRIHFENKHAVRSAKEANYKEANNYSVEEL